MATRCPVVREYQLWLSHISDSTFPPLELSRCFPTRQAAARDKHSQIRLPSSHAQRAGPNAVPHSSTSEDLLCCLLFDGPQRTAFSSSNFPSWELLPAHYSSPMTWRSIVHTQYVCTSAISYALVCFLTHFVAFWPSLYIGHMSRCK